MCKFVRDVRQFCSDMFPRSAFLKSEKKSKIVCLFFTNIYANQNEHKTLIYISFRLASFSRYETNQSLHWHDSFDKDMPIVYMYRKVYREELTCTVKSVLSDHSKRRPKMEFQYQLTLNAGQKYCRMLSWSILQYFRPSLSYHLSLRPLFLYVFE